MSEERKKRVETSRDPKVWKKWLDECVVTSSEVEQNDDSEDEEVRKSDHKSEQDPERMDTSVNEFDAQSDDEDDSGSDDESGDSSDEDLESGEEEGSEDGEDVEEFVDENPSTISSDDAGSSGRERCPICLNKFVGQELGTPESCEHTFCFECIQEWSKNINTCPIDRTEFNNICVRATPDGNDIKKVKVKVRPKEAEDAPQESVTLCEVCQHGDREDRLLLCDGCDLAFHCECLDPPLFYIPIEEWFCPPCSGILQNRTAAAAGPSHSRSRRAIPRTRASETVRSRVQNLRRTQKSPAPRSTSSVSRKSAAPVKRKRRRTYRKAYKKVVQLARTKKSMSDAGKGKTAARGTTVVVTYRRRRRRRKKCGTRLSKRSKAVSDPSPQQRIAKRLGISKSFDGSTLPQVKASTSKGYRLGGRAAKMPSHSLFGNKNQLMDFSENFTEVDINAPSTSRTVSFNRRSSEDTVPPVSAPVNILDSILAGQTLLHSKSDNVVIKNDGSLVMKASSTNAKKVEVPKKSEIGNSSRTPMSVALVKNGAKSLILEKLLRKKKNEMKCTEEKVCSGESSNSHSTETALSQSKRITHKTSSTACSSNHKSSTKQNRDSKLFDEEKYKRSSLSTFKIPKKKPDRCKESDQSSSSNVEDLNSITDYLQSDMPSDWESELSNPVISVTINNRTSSAVIKNKKYSKYNESGNSSRGSDTSQDKLYRYNASSRSMVNYNSSSEVSDPTVCTYIKKEVESDSNLCENAETVHIKQEILSDEETNVDCWIKNTADITKHKSEENHMINIKTETVDSDSDTNASEPCNFENGDGNDETSESENSDYDASQSIIDSVPANPIGSSQYDKCKSKTPHIKIKEEVPSDSEEYSQSLVSNIDMNLNSEHLSYNAFLEKSSQLKAKNVHISKLSKDLSDDSLPCTQVESYAAVYGKIATDHVASNITNNNNLHSVEQLPSTQISPVEFDSSENKRTKKMLNHVSSLRKHNQTLPDDDDFTTTLIDPASESSKESSSSESDDELPPTQINPPLINAFSSSSTIQNKVSLNNQIKVLSRERTPPTQTINSHILCNKSMLDKLSSKQPTQSREIVDLPETQAPSETLSSTLILNAQNNISNLPNTQTDTLMEKPSTSGRRIIWTSISGNDSVNKSDTKASTRNKKSSLVDKKSLLTSKKVANVPETQVNEQFSLPATQVLDESSNESCTSPPPDTFSSPIRESSDLPATQVFHENFKEPSSIPEAQIVDSFSKEPSLPATQIFNSTFKEPSLPATQIFNSTFKEPSLPATQIIDATFKEPFVLPSTEVLATSISSTSPATQIFDATLKEPLSLPETQKLDYTLPATQVSDPSLSKSHDNSKNNANSSENLVSDLGSSPQNQVQNKTKSINDLISNIKQIVNSLTKNPSDGHISKCQGDTNHAKSGLDCDNSSADSSDSKKMSGMSTDEMDKENSNASNENLELNKNASDSEDDDDLSPEKLKELLCKSGKVKSPKNLGVHRHLPQVITVKPVKQLLKPKPPNRKTFSFEEVAKLEGPLTSKENYRFETDLDNSCIESDDLPATQLSMWPERNKNDLSETQKTLNDVNNSLEASIASPLLNQSYSLKTDIAAKKVRPQIQNGKRIFPTSYDEHNIPATQTCSLNQNKSLSPNTKIRELIDITDTNEMDLPATQIFDSSNENSLKLHNKMKQRKVVYDDEESSLLVTHVFSYRDENNFLKPLPKIKKENVSDSEVNDLPATQVQGFRDRHDKSNILSISHTDVFDCVTQKDQEYFNLINSNDLPATQLFCNAPVKNSNEFQRSATCNDKSISKSDLSAKSKPHQKSAQSLIAEKSKDTRKHNESIDYVKDIFTNTSLNDNISHFKKHSKNHASKYFDAEKRTSSKDHKRDPKRFHDNVQDEKELMSKKHILTRIKLEPPDNEETFISERKGEKSENLSSNSIKERLDTNTNSRKHSETTQVIKIKQEKNYDFNFEKPLQVSKTVVSHSNMQNGVIKIKSEEPSNEESLPPTQIVNFDVFDESFPPTQIFYGDQTTAKNIISNSNHKSNHEFEILSPVHIKKEVVSDDEVSIIEVKDRQEIILKKEIISIDDCLENSEFDKSAAHLSSNSCKKDLPVQFEKSMEECKLYMKKNEVVKNTFKTASKSKSDKMVDIDSGRHINMLGCNLHEEDKAKHDNKSSKSNSKHKNSKHDLRDIEKEKYSTDNKLSKVNKKSGHSNVTSIPKHKDSDCYKDGKKYKSSKDDSVVSKECQTKQDKELLKSKSKHSNSKCTSTDIGKRKSSTDSISTNEEKKMKHDSDLSKSKSKNRDFENNFNGIENHKKSSDLAPVREDKYKKQETNFKSKSRDIKGTDKTKNSKPSSKEENTHEKQTDYHSENKNLKSDKIPNFQKDVDQSKHLKFQKATDQSKHSKSQKDTDQSKHLKSHKETNDSSDKERLARSSSEKENDISFKINHDAKEVLVTSRKRSHNLDNKTEQKKLKFDESSNSTSFSEDLSSHLSGLQNGSCKGIVRTSSVSSMEWNLNENSQDFPEMESPNVHQKRDMKKISRKKDLKEEIANEVKLVLKPFYSTCLISKEDYKDIMRRAVPKIFMNCHNCINPDKIRKLVLSYVSLLNKS